jgi:PAS domain S-box-containing protein
VVEATKQGGEIAPGDYRVTCKDGTVRIMSISGVRIGENLLVTMVDVTGRKRSEDALRASESRFRRLVTGLPIGVFQANADQGCTFMNEAGQQISGLTEAQALGGGWKRTLHPDDASRITGLWSDVVATDGSFSGEYRFLRPDGQVGWVKGWATALPGGPDGKLEMVGAIVDITARKEAESALRESDAKLRAFTNAVPDPIFLKDRDGTHLFVNQAFCGLFGKSAEEILGKMDSEVFDDPAVVAVLMENDRRVLASDVPEVVEETVPTPSGPRVFQTTKVPYRDERGQIVGIVGSAHDITNRKLMEDALRASEQRYRSVVASMAEGVVVRNAEGTVVNCNGSAERILGLSEAEMKMLPVPDPDWNGTREDGTAISSGDHPALVALRTGQPQSHVVTGLRTEDGSATWMLSNSEPLFDPSGRVHGVVTTMSDITERRALRQQLAVSSRLAAMGTLVAGVAHEINNPLAAELADQGLALEVVKQVRARLRGDVPFDREAKAELLDEVVEVLEEAQGAGARIARIVRDLATFGQPDTVRKRVRLAEVVGAAMQSLPAATAAAASITVQDDGAPEVMASSGQIEQVVSNLVSNAAKAMQPTKHGEILIRLGPGNPGMARLEVSDDGVGISPGMQDRVFEPFFTTRPVGEGRGTGLGLAISHAIATSHGGTLTVESEVGKGSTFRVELPAAPAEPQSPTLPVTSR